MKIVRAESILVSVPFEAGGIPPWSFGGMPECAFDTLLIRLETESGIVGWGEAFSREEDTALKSLIDKRVLPLVLGRDAPEIAKIKFDLEFDFRISAALVQFITGFPPSIPPCGTSRERLSAGHWLICSGVRSQQSRKSMPASCGAETRTMS